MTTVLPTSFAEFLQQQRAAYVNSLPGRLAQLETLAQQWDQGAPAGVLPDLERWAHGLAGSAGTFGFAALGETARALELIVEEVRDGAQQGAEITSGLAALRAQLRELVAATATE